MEKEKRNCNRYHGEVDWSGESYSEGFGDYGFSLGRSSVVGGQSSGSAREHCWERFWGSGIVTRRPLVLQLHKTEGRQEEYAEFGRRRFTVFSLARKEIQDETDRITGKSKQISPIPIHFSIYSPNIVNLTLIDLPGLTNVFKPFGAQPTKTNFWIFADF